MNILVVSESVWMRGVIYDLHIVAEGLASMNYNVYALDPGEIIGDGFEFQKVKRLSKSRKSIILISPRLLDRVNIRRFRKMKKIFNSFFNRKIRSQYVKLAISTSNCDVILLYSGVRLGPEITRYARKHGIPVVFRNVDKLYNLWPTTIQQLMAMYREHVTYKRIDIALALTPNYRKYLIELGSPKENTRVIPFPIDTEVFSPKTLSASDKKIIASLGVPSSFFDSKLIVFMGTFYEFTGLIDLIHEAHERIQNGDKFKFLLIGDGPIRNKMEQLIKNYKLGKNVFITGYLNFDLMPTLINLAKVCINGFPVIRRTEDIFSAKIIQFLSCGKPVVSTSMPGIVNAIPSESSGVIYKEDLKTVLKTAIMLLQDEKKCEYLGKCGREFILMNNNAKLIVGQIAMELGSAYELSKRAKRVVSND